MASWMVHLRIADQLLDILPGIAAQPFVMGNIAPDSGVPNEDWSRYVPDKKTSHYQKLGPDGEKYISLQDYQNEYFTPKQQAAYSDDQYSFFLGYLTHLMTDQLWLDEIFYPCGKKHPGEFYGDRMALIRKMKADWYDLDFLYLKKNPDPRAFRIYAEAEGFVNRYMPVFAPDALDNRRRYIVDFYRSGRTLTDREYPYLTEAQMDAFVARTAQSIARQIARYRSR